MQTITPTAPTTAVLPVHPRRGGWRTGAAASLVAFAVSELRAGRSPHRDIAALARLGVGAGTSGLAAAQEVDRRLAAALVPLVDDLRLRAARSAAFDGPGASAPTGPGDEVADVLVSTLFDGMGAAALDGCPHPGEWVASSVDVVPCAEHGYEDGPVDCLRRSAAALLAGAVHSAAGSSSSTAPTTAEQVLAAETRPDDVDGDPVLRALWAGVAALAAWQAHVAAA